MTPRSDQFSPLQCGSQRKNSGPQARRPAEPSCWPTLTFFNLFLIDDSETISLVFSLL